MPRSVLVLLILLLASSAASAQSGRKSSIKVPVSPPPPVAAPSPSPDPTKPAKPPLPKFVDGERIYTSRETDDHFEILSKPEPHYTRTARRHRTHGQVLIRAILAADATVKHVEVLVGLPDGLSEEAVKVAHQIKFRPARQDDKPVSVWVELEYQFSIF
jgi:TonB family protein